MFWFRIPFSLLVTISSFPCGWVHVWNLAVSLINTFPPTKGRMHIYLNNLRISQRSILQQSRFPLLGVASNLWSTFSIRVSMQVVALDWRKVASLITQRTSCRLIVSVFSRVGRGSYAVFPFVNGHCHFEHRLLLVSWRRQSLVLGNTTNTNPDPNPNQK